MEREVVASSVDGKSLCSDAKGRLQALAVKAATVGVGDEDPVCTESPSGPRPSRPLRHEAETQPDSRRRREQSHLEEEEHCQAVSWAVR